MNNKLFYGVLIAFIVFLDTNFGGKYPTKTEKLVTSRIICKKAYAELFLLTIITTDNNLHTSFLIFFLIQ